MAMKGPLGGSRLDEAVIAGQTAFEDNRFEDAVLHFKTALRIGARNSEEEALIRCDLSQALGRRGLAREQLDAVSKYDNFPKFVQLTEKTQMQVLIRLGWAFSFNNDVPRAIALFNQANRIARRLNDDAGIGECFFGLGRAYRNLNEVRIAHDHYAAALEHYRRVGNWRELAESYINIGYINAFEGKYKNAMRSLKQALALIGDRQEYGLFARAHMYLAITYDHIGSTKRALASWESCVESFRLAGNSLYVAINQNNLAMKLIWLGDWARAEQLARSASDILRPTTSIASFAGTLDTLAQICILRGRLDEAQAILEESLSVLNSIKVGEWVESSTQTTVGVLELVKGRPDLAMKPLERAVDICLRSGTQYFLQEARLWLAEAMLASNDIKGARTITESVMSDLHEAPNLVCWGFMMRTVAKIEAAEGHTAAAIQSLGQSSSIYEIRDNVYACAVNKVVLARMYAGQGRFAEARELVESTLSVFERLGAVIEHKQGKEYLESLQTAPPSGPKPAEQPEAPGLDASRAVPDLASAVDGFIARRIVQASVSRELLLHELASVAAAQSESRAALVAEVDGEALKAETSVGLGEVERGKELEVLRKVRPEDYAKRFVYPFADNQQSRFLLYLIGPRAERFISGTVDIRPLLYLVEQGLETEFLRSKYRRAQTFDPNQLLSEVELPGFICASRAMTRVLEQIHKIRSSDVTVLITGESGTGKELIARAVHAGSSRRFNVFLPFNCSAAPRDMIESQLFGYRKGSFTGATQSYEGIIRAAERGTLFLDEIGDLPLDLQPKLLRFLQEGEIHPLGESHPLRVDVRVVAATNSDLERAVAEGKFREDLFHRLNVIRIQVPPLRERREETPALINHYLNAYQQEAGKTEIMLSEETVDLMVVYDWPGNVRQLCNELRRIVAYSDSGMIVPADMLSPEITQAGRKLGTAPLTRKKGTAPSIITGPGTTLSEAVNELERRMIEEALGRSAGNVAQAAKDLGLSRKGLYLKMDRLKFHD